MGAVFATALQHLGLPADMVDVVLQSVSAETRPGAKVGAAAGEGAGMQLREPLCRGGKGFSLDLVAGQRRTRKQKRLF